MGQEQNKNRTGTGTGLNFRWNIKGGIGYLSSSVELNSRKGVSVKL